MDAALVQTLIVGAIVLAAAVFLVRRAWRTLGTARRSGSQGVGCSAGGACGCSEDAAGATERDASNPTARR